MAIAVFFIVQVLLEFQRLRQRVRVSLVAPDPLKLVALRKFHLDERAADGRAEIFQPSFRGARVRANPESSDLVWIPGSLASARAPE
jgi:hypothetical protein